MYRDIEWDQGPKRLLTSLEHLISPEILSTFSGDTITTVQCVPMPGGLSGSRLFSVEASGAHRHRFVLKRMSPRTDWVMQTSEDTVCRSVALWQHGILDRLSAYLDHVTLACARDPDKGWAILMRDVGESIMEADPWSVAEIKLLLDALAAIHVTFWTQSELADPALGLCDHTTILQALSVETVRNFSHGTYATPALIIEGWNLLQPYLDADVKAVLTRLLCEPLPLVKALDRFPATLLHVDYRGDNLGLQARDPRAIVLDWQIAGYGLAAIDLAFFISMPNVSGSSFTSGSAIDYYRSALERGLQIRFGETEWQEMMDLAMLVYVLRITPFVAWTSVHSESPLHMANAQRRLHEINNIVRSAVKWL